MAASSPHPYPISRPMVRYGTFRGIVGCGPTCSEEYGHNAGFHERYGRSTVFAELAARRVGGVATGALVVDFTFDVVTLDGAELVLTPTERALLYLLAERLGGIVRHTELIAGIWSTMPNELYAECDDYRRLRTNLGRLRAKLGASRDLIETVTGVGLRLRRVHTDHTGGPPMTTNAVALSILDDEQAATALAHVLATGDLAGLSPKQRVGHYLNQCRSLGLNPISRPFDWLTLDGKLVLYPNKGCAEQLRRAHQISVKIIRKEIVGELYVCEVEGRTPDGRTDQASKYVALTGQNKAGQTYRLTGNKLGDAFAKAETGAKRRLVLSMVGLSSPPDDDAAEVKYVVVDGAGNVLAKPTEDQEYLARTPSAARSIGEPTFETTATPDDDPFADAAVSQAATAAELRRPARAAEGRSSFKRPEDDIARLFGAWFAAVKGSSLDTDEARHRFIGQWTAGLDWPKAKRTDSLRTFYARATNDEVAELLAHTRVLVDDETRARFQQDDPKTAASDVALDDADADDE